MSAVKYLTDWIVWFNLIIPIGAGLMVTYQAFRKSLSFDDDVIADASKKIKQTIKGAIVGVSISGLITVMKSFFL